MQTNRSGTQNRDPLIGSSRDDWFQPGDGDDWMFGDGGNGADTMLGGLGNGWMNFASETTCLDKAPDFKGGSTLDFDPESVNGVGGSSPIVLDGVTHNVAAGASTAKAGSANWTTFCSHLPESVSFGATKGVMMRGADEAFVVSEDIAKGGSVPAPETVLRGLALERAQTPLLQDMLNDIGLKGCEVLGLVHGGQQEQIGVEEPGKFNPVQLSMREIADDCNDSLSGLTLGGGDFATDVDIIEAKGHKSTDVDALTFVPKAENTAATGAQKNPAIILDTSGDAIVFDDLGNRNAGGAAVVFDDEIMLILEWLTKASAPAIAGSVPAPVGDKVDASIAIKNSWWGGFQGEITVTAKYALTHWDVLLGTKFNVNGVWGADVGGSTVTVDGKLIDLNDANWNATLAAGQTATIGFAAETGFAGVMSHRQLMDGLWIG